MYAYLYNVSDNISLLIKYNIFLRSIDHKFKFQKLKSFKSMSQVVSCEFISLGKDDMPLIEPNKFKLVHAN